MLKDVRTTLMRIFHSINQDQFFCLQLQMSEKMSVRMVKKSF